MAAPLKNMYYDMLKTKVYPEPHYQGRAFLICNSCFWCASILYDDVQPFRMCPICMNNELEFMPLSNGETYNFDYDERHGVRLEFMQPL